MRYVLISWLFLGLLFSGNPLAATSYSRVADQIQHKMESILYTFKPSIQSHYAIRMYRLTGKEKYFYPILFNQLIASLQYQRIFKQLKGDKTVTEEMNLEFPEQFVVMDKWEKRAYILKHFPKIKKELQLLYLLSTASQLNLLESSLYPNSKEAIQYLKINREALKRFLLHPTFIKYASPNMANEVYYLEAMKIIDIRQDYQKAFQSVFNASNDPSLTDDEYTEKIYGMTHIIIAASHYYQRKVSKKEFDWIYRYFDRHMDEMLSRLKYDVIIEVGLCYLLADQLTNEAAVLRIKSYVLNKFDPKTNLISEPWDRGDFERSEHRNVLTLLFLKWTQPLHPGPDLLNSKQYQYLMEPQSPL